MTEPVEINCKQAWSILQEDPRALMIDVRSSMEFLFVGHAKGSVHIPWIDEPDWDINPHFVADVQKGSAGRNCQCVDEEGCVSRLS